MSYSFWAHEFPNDYSILVFDNLTKFGPNAL